MTTNFDRRPRLHIEDTCTTPRHCVHVTTFVITSRLAITQEGITALRNAGFLGSGQSWQSSGPTVKEMVYTPDGVDWAGRPYLEVRMPYFEYTVTDTCYSD